MLPFSSIVPLIFLKLGEIFFSPLFWAVILLIGLMHRRLSQVKESLFGLPEEPLWPEMIRASLFGILGGVVGSFLLVLTGISLTMVGVTYLWIVAALLMFISPHLLCFSYSAGLISLSHLLWGWPEVDVPQLMGLVAVLHMVESLLIRFSGHLGAVPIYARNSRGEIAGAFNLQKFWPLPLVGLVLVAQVPESGKILAVPQWWPLIKPNMAQITPESTYVLFPLVAALGYSDLAMAHTPEKKSKKSSRELGLYSLILLVLAIIASHQRSWSILAALFGPLGHEYLIRRGRKAEMTGSPLYTAVPGGVKILNVERNSLAQKLGLKSGDVLTKVNQQPVENKEQLFALLKDYSGPLKVTVKRGLRTFEREGIQLLKVPFGIIPVPEPAEPKYVEIQVKGWLLRIMEKFKR